MAHAYTPGLKVTKGTLLRKSRILPLKGEVLVKAGDAVEPDQVVARTHLPGEVMMVNVANQLGVPPEDVAECMIKKPGDSVEDGEVIGRAKSFFGLFKSEAKANMTGSFESVSFVTGQAVLRGAPIPVEVKAYIHGKVVEVIEQEGVVVETWASFVQGIFGIGGESHGEIKVACTDPGQKLTEEKIDASFEGKIVVGGELVTAEALRKAIRVKARGVISGGFNDKDLKDFLGYDLGVAITGHEDIGITLVVTEGFGEIAMAQKTHELLCGLEGKTASINGATQIRAGVIRPEVVIPFEGTADTREASTVAFTSGLENGSPVRIIRHPYFGNLGKVSDLPPELQVLESGSKARVLEVEFPDGKKAIIPRANVELLED